ncbi:hypothetical protein PAXRUDRAFT_823518 [Paxillus rubicundulus Ve08.2h10]|uniref:RRM domain-containing protein n=1 Tax=Paxillus rubicundulus Ve08.2h10 TaxID=930991 RepID=A0A0D0E3G8_9AGAM|nr:hypothetical protein PAXRUDRAFT_823518 [Paxillus rubicundulus Ve08.2h10]
MASSSQPNTTLYINNLNDKVNKDELRSQLYALFTTYGKIIDVVASKSPKMRGQAFLVFTDLAAATTAMRACEGMVFYDKPMRITYAKAKSYATSRREDPNFVPPTSVHARPELAQIGKITVSSADKRQRDDGIAEGQPQPKREKSQDDDSDGEEMEIDEDEENAQHNKPLATLPPPIQQPSARLLCTNLPKEVTDDVLSVLFQQYRGFLSTHVAPSPTPNAAGVKVKIAQVFFESADLASTAKEALDNFTLKKGWKMSVVYF